MGTKEKWVIWVSFFFVMATLPLLPQNTGRQAQTKTVDEVIQGYISGCGGEALNHIETEKRVGTLVKGSAGRVPFTSVSTAAGQWYYNQVFAFGDQVSYGFDGHNAWVADQNGVSEIDPHKALELRILFDVQFPLRLRDIFPEMNLNPIHGSGDATHVVISARTGDLIPMELVFDQETGLLVRAGDLYFSDYTKAGDVVRPHTIHMGHEPGVNGLRLTMKVEKISFDGSPDEEIFSPPPCPLTQTRAPLYTRRRQIRVANEVLDACAGKYRRIDESDQTIIIKRQDNHLMMKTARSPYFIEIKPESELDYFVRFLNLEIHFLKNDKGDVVRLELGPERHVVAEKINPE